MEQRSWPEATAESPAPDWRRALDDLERSLLEAVEAIGALRLAFEQAAPAEAPAPVPRHKTELVVVPGEEASPQPEEEPAPEAEAPPAGADVAAGGFNQAEFERVWERLKHEKRERGEDDAPPEPEPAPASAEPAAAGAPDKPRGLALLPQQYLMTVEDRESRVDLVPLHRALLRLVKMEDISLVSFANGAPVISVRVLGDMDMERLREAVATTMDRQCEVIEQGNNKLFLRLTPHPAQRA